MEHSIFKETIGQKGLEIYLKGRTFDKLFWPQFFPLKRKTKLTVETLIGEQGNRVAADIVTYDSPAPLKKRPVVDKMTTPIPPIRISRKMSESDLNDYFGLLADADQAAQREALKLAFADVDFVIDGINARLDWLAIQVISKGVVSLTAANNVGPSTDATIDFRLPAGNKEYIGSAGGTADANHYWEATDSATNDPIADIEAIVSEAEDNGVQLRYMLMDKTRWSALRVSTAFQNFCRSFLVDGVAYRTQPSLKVANSALRDEQLPEIILINTRVNIEDKDHNTTSTNPWNTGYVTFTPSLELGNMLYCPTAEERAPSNMCMYSKKGPILVSKFRDTNPVAEMTVGLLNAFPSFPMIDQCWCINTLSHTAF